MTETILWLLLTLSSFGPKWEVYENKPDAYRHAIMRSDWCDTCEFELYTVSNGQKMKFNQRFRVLKDVSIQTIATSSEK